MHYVNLNQIASKSKKLYSEENRRNIKSFLYRLYLKVVPLDVGMHVQMHWQWALLVTVKVVIFAHVICCTSAIFDIFALFLNSLFFSHPT